MRFIHKKFEPFGAVRISAAKNNNPQNPDFFAIIWIAEPKAALIKNAMLASALLRVRPKNSLPIYQSKRFGAQAGFCAKEVLLYLPDFRI